MAYRTNNSELKRFNKQANIDSALSLLFITGGIIINLDFIGIFSISSVAHIALNLALSFALSLLAAYLFWFKKHKETISQKLRVALSVLCAFFIWIPIFDIPKRALMFLYVHCIVAAIGALAISFREFSLDSPLYIILLPAMTFLVLVCLFFEIRAQYSFLHGFFNSVIPYLSLSLGAVGCAVSIPTVKKHLPHAKTKKKQKEQKRRLPLYLLGIFLAVIFSSYLLLSCINISLDFSQPEIYNARIQDVNDFAGHTKYSRNRYEILVAIDGESIWVEVPYDARNDDFVVGRTVKVTVGRGLLGEEYAFWTVNNFLSMNNIKI